MTILPKKWKLLMNDRYGFRLKVYLEELCKALRRRIIAIKIKVIFGVKSSPLDLFEWDHDKYFSIITLTFIYFASTFFLFFCNYDITSLQPLIVNSLNGRISSIKRFISRNLSLNPTKTYKPDGCKATLYASSWNTLYNSRVLKITKK